MTTREAAAEALARFEAAVIEQERAAAETGSITSGVWQWITGTGDLGESIQARAESARALYEALAAKYAAASSDAEYSEILAMAGKHANVADLADAVRLTQPGAVVGTAIKNVPATVAAGAQSVVSSVVSNLSPWTMIAVVGIAVLGIFLALRKKG